MTVTQVIRRGLVRLRGRDSVAQITRGAGVAFLLTGVGQALATVLQVVLARGMGRAEFGTYTWVTAWVTTLVVPLGLGLPQAAVRFIPEYAALGDHSRRKGFIRFSQSLVLAVAVGVAVIATAVLVVLHAYRPLPSFYPLLFAAWLLPISTQLSLMSQMCRALRRILLAFGPIRVLSPAILIVSVIALHELKFRLDSALVLAITAIITLGLLLVQMAIFRHTFAREDVGAPAHYEARRWLGVALPLMLMAACQTLLVQIGILIVGSLCGPRDAAIYGAASRFVSLIGFTLVTTNVALGPEVADLYSRGELATLQKVVSATVRMAFWPALAATVVLVVLGRPILLLYGHGYASSGYATMCILAIGALVNAASGPVFLLLNMTGLERLSIRVLGISSVLSLAMSIVLVNQFGFIGAAMASSAALALWNIWMAVLAKRHLGINSFIGFAR